MSEETTCYVSTEYFGNREGIEDFVIHEVSHLFHNCKRHTVGLQETRTKEWLLDIEFRKRETFAYACEGYGAIVERVNNRAGRLALAEQFAKQVESYDREDFDPVELAAIVREACAVRNGWKVILARCAPEKRKRQETPVSMIAV